MDRQSGTGLIILGIIFAALGAILAYAVTATISGFSIHEAGVVLLAIGVVAVVLGIVVATTSGRRSTVLSEQVHRTPDGSVRVVEQKEQMP